MALPDNVKQWWDGFVEQFTELGYDINNPADRSCLYKVSNWEQVPYDSTGSIINSLYFSEIGNIEAAEIDKEKDYADSIYAHRADYAYTLQEPITDGFINKLYTAATHNELYLYDVVKKLEVYTPENKIGEGEFFRTVGVTEDGKCFTSRIPYEIVNETEKQCKEQNIEKSSIIEQKTKEAFEKELEGVVVDKTSIYYKDVQNKTHSLFQYIYQGFSGKEMTQGGELVKGAELTDEEFNEFVDEIGSFDPAKAYWSYRELAFKDAHAKGFDSEYLKNSDGIRTLSSNPKLSADEHLDSLMEQNNGKYKFQELVGEDVPFLDKDMKPIDLSDPSKVKSGLKDGGLFFYKPGDKTPTRVGFDQNTNTLGITNKAVQGPEPTLLLRAISGVVRVFTGSDLAPCREYYKYKEGQKNYDAAVKAKEQKASQQTASQQTEEPSQKEEQQKTNDDSTTASKDKDKAWDVESEIYRFATADDGLGRCKGSFTDKREASDYKGFFRDEEGDFFTEFSDIKKALESGKKVYAYKNGEEMPRAISLDENEKKLKCGESLDKELQEVPKVGFLSRVFSVFSKNLRDKVKAYDDYVADKKVKDAFESKRGMRQANVDREKEEKRLEDADKNHEAQKQKNKIEMSRLRTENPSAAIEAHNTWHTVPYTRMCMELGRQAFLADPMCSTENMDKYSAEDISQGSKEWTECEKMGHQIFANLIENASSANASKDSMEMIETVIANVVNKKTTDKEARDFKDFLKMAYVDIGDRSSEEYAGFNFEDKSAKIQINEDIGANTVIQDAPKAMNKRDHFDDVCAYMAMSAYYAYVDGNTAGSQGYNSKQNVDINSGIVRMGEAIGNLQMTLKNVRQAEEESGSASLEQRHIGHINKVQMMIGSFNSKEPGGECNFEQLLNNKNFVGKSEKGPNVMVNSVAQSYNLDAYKEGQGKKISEIIAENVMSSKKIEAGYNQMTEQLARKMLANDVILGNYIPENIKSKVEKQAQTTQVETEKTKENTAEAKKEAGGMVK